MLYETDFTLCFIAKRAALPRFIARHFRARTHERGVYSRFKRCSLDRFFLCHLCTVTHSRPHTHTYRKVKAEAGGKVKPSLAVRRVIRRRGAARRSENSISALLTHN